MDPNFDWFKRHDTVENGLKAKAIREAAYKRYMEDPEREAKDAKIKAAMKKAFVAFENHLLFNPKESLNDRD